ncbi:hypothetical protein D6783_00055 [Candidatus Woesearchaeota archaeon]|nr:MAG: hypothetical protein D6783_00055 [Candidatus Woesearchaeota archaeon]
MVRRMGECPKCGEHTALERHHVYPVRHYGKRNNRLFLLLCRECHRQLEWHIPFEKMPDTFYRDVIRCFLNRYYLPLKGTTYVETTRHKRVR